MKIPRWLGVSESLTKTVCEDNLKVLSQDKDFFLRVVTGDETSIYNWDPIHEIRLYVINS